MLGLEQSCETVVPEVIIKKQFKPFLEDEIGSVVKDSIALMAHPCEKIFDPEGEKKILFLLSDQKVASQNMSLKNLLRWALNKFLWAQEYKE